VTQGTLSNFDFGQLVAPTLAALANDSDVLVVVTTGGRSLDAIPGLVPTNARLATYLPFEWLLPKVDVLVTNGGYGSVNQGLSFGVPLVTAGLTEDKADVNVRVAWSGAGINLATNSPTPQALHKAVRAVLENPNYRARVSSIAEEYRGIDTRYEIIRILGQVTDRTRSIQDGRQGACPAARRTCDRSP
jgi:UDP:flavonoid glycosyltransferase YjiC (YdhE family)